MYTKDRSTSFQSFARPPTPTPIDLPNTQHSLRLARQELRRRSGEVNFNAKDLPTLVATLQYMLQSSPDDPLIRIKSLKYLGESAGSRAKTALDNTPFARSGGKKKIVEIVVDESNFDPETFLAMSKVTLFAEAEVGRLVVFVSSLFLFSFLLLLLLPLRSTFLVFTSLSWNYAIQRVRRPRLRLLNHRRSSIAAVQILLLRVTAAVPGIQVSYIPGM